ncbi:hypothetical protein CSPX01_08882 [Colletotrichum filicis]|nr:hypothetical protein CSPX01_08882 [Colletotrichum filicis]
MRETLSTFQDSFSHPAEGDPDEGLGSTTEVFRFLLSAIGEEITWYNLLRTGAFPMIYGERLARSMNMRDYLVPGVASMDCVENAGYFEATPDYDLKTPRA